MDRNVLNNIVNILCANIEKVHGVITGHWSTMDGKLMYECHYKELDGTEGDLDNLMRKDFEVVPNKFINLTPHTITLNNGTEYHPSGKVARVANKFSNFCCAQCSMVKPEEGTIYIVSALVLAAAKEKGRTDVVAPATGHPDCVRENGFIVSVPGFVR